MKLDHLPKEEQLRVKQLLEEHRKNLHLKEIPKGRTSEHPGPVIEIEDEEKIK